MTSARELSMIVIPAKGGTSRENGSSGFALLKQIDAGPQHSHRVVEGIQRSIGAREHHPALHRGEREDGESTPIEFSRQTIAGVDETPFDRVDPTIEVRGQQLPNRRIRLAARRAAK